MGGVASPLDLGVALVSGSTVHMSEDALSTLVSLIEADLEACNRVIVGRMDSPVALIRSSPPTSWLPEESGCGRY